ncbi:MAG: NUDIX hydrolase, partial [Actinomycetota bacterium]
MRPGYGTRHPCIERLIARAAPLASERVSWPNGLELVNTAYAEPIDLISDDLVRSVRCITRVGDGIVVCDTPDGEHIMPGGRREPGETFIETAVREVHEETGWHLIAGAVTYLGLWHIEFLNPEIGDPTLPRPDIVQVIQAGIATDRDVDPDAAWKDTQGWE